MGGASAEQQASAFARLKNALAGWETKKPADIVVEEANKSNREKLSGPSENWQTYRTKEKEAIEKAPLRRKAREFDNKIKSIRKNLPISKLRKRGNMGMAEVNIEGLPEEFFAHSQIDSSVDRGAELNIFSLVKEEEYQVFDYEPVKSWEGGDAYLRNIDTEAKILEDIASRIDKNTIGTIDLYTEKPPCESCSKVIAEFGRRYPNIKLTIYHRDI